ncbi:galactosylceramide sulfotransferase-like [Glandiceps talaboti]
MLKKQACLLAVCCFCLGGIFTYGIHTTSLERWLKTPTLTVMNFGRRKEITRLSATLANATDSPGNIHLCQPLGNIVYIKTHKTGSTTLAAIIYRYGYQRNLSFLLSRSKMGHLRRRPLTSNSGPSLHPPINVSKGDYEHYEFNISAGHVIYNRHAFDFFIHGHPKYITIIREPAKQFESSFSFFSYRHQYMKGANISKTIPFAALEEFVEHTDRYENTINKSLSHGITVKNTQFFDLGLPINKMADVKYVNKLISQIAAAFDLVLITEYFDESLILLKKELCWDLENIIYFKKNARFGHGDSPIMSVKLQHKIREFNKADVLLYDHFNKTLWQKIREYGPSFQSDLELFRRRLDDLKSDCIEGYEKQPKRSREVEVLKSNASHICQDLGYSHDTWFAQILERQHVSMTTLNSSTFRNIRRKNARNSRLLNTSRKKSTNGRLRNATRTLDEKSHS